MPSPLAHLATGLAIHLAARPNSLTPKDEARQIGRISLAALLPDLDFIPGLATGRIADFHNRESHSLLLTAGATTLLAVNSRATLRLTPVLFLASLSHLLLDGLGSRRGLMLFWPFNQRRYSGGIRVFHGVRWRTPLNSAAHRRTLLNELPYAVFVLLLGLFLGKLWR